MSGSSSTIKTLGVDAIFLSSCAPRVRGRYGQRKPEGRSLALLAVHPYAAPVAAHQLIADVQTQSQAADAARADVAATIEALKEIGLVFQGKPGPMVLHRDDRL